MKKRALISVSNKNGIVEFASKLQGFGYEIISTGGTKKALLDAGINVVGISEVTNFPEILNGRVKTLHPNVHGAILAVRDELEHQKQLEENSIGLIDIVAVNLYPFKETISKENVSYNDAIENIDIGGPSMLRSAAKNHKYVTVLCDGADYDIVLDELNNNGETTYETRSKLAAKAFRHTASYDAMISQYLTTQVNELSPESITMSFDLMSNLRYGENPHQKANVYKSEDVSFSITSGNQIHGKQLSYNNIQDANAALSIVKEFDKTVVVALKHMNPCGVGTSDNLYDAWVKAYESDPTSIFGGIVATNVEIDEKTAIKMSKIFLEIVIAPSFTDEAIKVLTKKKNIRLITVDMIKTDVTRKQLVSVSGGLLIQDEDSLSINKEDIEVVTKIKPTDKELEDLLFSWKVVKHVKSNAIIVAKDGQTYGVGAGQMNRVGAAKIALEWASLKDDTSDLSLASDAFFPFDDVVRLANEYGVKAIIQPGGSIRDEDSIKACDELGITMVFTKVRHFKH